MTNQTKTIKFYSGEEIPVEQHKVRIVQKLFLRPIEERKTAIEGAGFNTFLLNTKDVFLDMLTDSGTNAMSDNQISSMLQADDAYAGSQSFYRMEEAAERYLESITFYRFTKEGRLKTLFHRLLFNRVR